MSMVPLLSDSSDADDSRCECERKRRQSQGKTCCEFFYRMFPNVEDMSFSTAEIAYFDQSANNYNLARFRERDTNPRTATNACLTLYFLANFAIVQGNCTEGYRYVREGLEVAKSSRKPDLYTLLLASPLARVLYMEDNIDALRSQLHDCFHMIDALGRGAPGSVLGWLFYMRARSHKNDRSAAVEDFELAIDAFNKSETIDKDFGVAHTLCRLILCRLGCGENGNTIDSIETPIPSEMREVECHFKKLTEMAIVNQNIVIKIIYLMAETDYNFRTRNTCLAWERAKEAHRLAVNSKCHEFLEVTKEREDIYTGKHNEIADVEHGKTCVRQQNVFINAQNIAYGYKPRIIKHE